MFTAADQDQFFAQVLFIATGQPEPVRQMEFVSGGCINLAVRLQTSLGDFFLKFNELPEAQTMLATEAQGLQRLARAGARVPAVRGQGQVTGRAFLLLEYLPPAPAAPGYWQQLGRELAQLHRHQSPTFGLDHDNFIGSLRQANPPAADGFAFWAEHRLQAQAGLAYYNGLAPASLLRQVERLCAKLPQWLPAQPASLLHGDLWSGNQLPNGQGQPTLIDPAVYFGFREAELAFTKLFGGFEDDFYHAYHEAYPLEPGFGQRAELYNLYPLLVHTNLFGASYLGAVERTLARWL
jgi:protein-ribulosamine 3-kinase